MPIAERIELASPSTTCHRGILRVDGALPAFEAPVAITYEPLAPGLWSCSDGIYRTVVAEGRTGLVAFDTFGTPGAATSYRQALTRLFPRKPIHTVVYSHDHLDHAGYAFDLAPHAEVIAHHECQRVVIARESDGQRPATETWDGHRRAYDIDGVAFELLYPGPTHGNGNAAALFPAAGLMFMVDTVIPGVAYTFVADWHLRSYVHNMRHLLSVEGWTRFVPGHFWEVDREGFERNLGYFERMQAAAWDALADGVDPDEHDEVKAWALERLEEELGQLFRFHEYIGLNLMRFMAHAETGGWGLEDHEPLREAPPWA